MTPTEIRTLRQSLGLTQAAAARLCGVALRTWGSWEAGERRLCDPEARLIRLLAVPEARHALEGMERLKPAA
jgi:DNA-binding transcriptional regulator YiaG